MEGQSSKRGRYENTSSLSSSAVGGSTTYNPTATAALPIVNDDGGLPLSTPPSLYAPSGGITSLPSSASLTSIPPEYSYLASLQLLRNECLRWCMHLTFEKLVKQHLIRLPIQTTTASSSSSAVVSKGTTPSSRLIYVINAEKATEDYDIEFPTDEYTLNIPSSVTNSQTRSVRIKCRWQLRCYDFIAQKYQLVKLNFISNSPATVPEIREFVGLFTTSPTVPFPVPLPDELTSRKIIDLYTRIIQDTKEGKSCLVVPDQQLYNYLQENNGNIMDTKTINKLSHIWGTGSSSSGSTSPKIMDQVILLFRSWLAQDILQEQYAYQVSVQETSNNSLTTETAVSLSSIDLFPSLSSSSSSSSSGNTNIVSSISSQSSSLASMIVADDTWATAGENLQPCIAIGRDIDTNGIGHGPMGVTERTIGNYMYLFAHRCQCLPSSSSSSSSSSSTNTVTSSSSSDFLAPLTMTASVYDEGIPDITAWRAVRTYIDNDVPLSVFREAIISEIHALPSVPSPLSSLIKEVNNPTVDPASSSLLTVVTDTLSSNPSTTNSSSSSINDPSVPVYYNSTGHCLRRIHTNQLIYIVDLDYIARARSYTLSMNNTGTNTSSQSSLPIIQNDHTNIPLIYDRYYLDRYARQYIANIIGETGPLTRTTVKGDTIVTDKNPHHRIHTDLNRSVTNPRVAEMIKVTQRQDPQATTQRYYQDGHMDQYRIPSLYSTSLSVATVTNHSTRVPSVISYTVYPHGLLFLSERQMLEQFVNIDRIDILTPLTTSSVQLHLYESDLRHELSPSTITKETETVLTVHEDIQKLFVPYIGNTKKNYDETKLETLPDITNLSEGIVQAGEGLYRTENFREKFTLKEKSLHYSGYLPSWAIHEPIRTLTNNLNRSLGSIVIGTASASNTPGNLTPEYNVVSTTNAGAHKRSRYREEDKDAEDANNGRKKSSIVSFNPHGPLWVPSMFPHRWGYHKTVGYHGTSVIMGKKILETGFYRAQCRQREACKDGHCDCNMGGFGCYFGGDRNKADYYALRRAVYDSEKNTHTGATVLSVIDLGNVHVARRIPCSCGCGTNYVDHWGSWYNLKGYDSLYTRDNSAGAVIDREWAIADPLRVQVHSIVKILHKGKQE